MGGKRTGLKSRVLPKRLVAGGLDRLHRGSPEVRGVIIGAQQIIDDGGGEEVASLLKQRAAHRVMHLDQLLARDELKLAQGQEIDRPQYIAAATTWLRYAQAIGLHRASRRLPSALAYAASVKEGAQ